MISPLAGKNILNINQREGGDPGLDWDQGRGLNSVSHTRIVIIMALIAAGDH